MVRRNFVETVMGGVVLIVAAGFVIFAYKSGKVQTIEGYTLLAKFDRADGLVIGSDVRVSGLKVGTVIDQKVDPKTYQAVIKLSVADEVKLPKDSAAEIISDGLLGGKYIALVPGGDEQTFSNNDEIQYTQSSVSIEQLIGKFMFSGDDKNKKQQNGDPENKNVPSL